MFYDVMVSVYANLLTICITSIILATSYLACYYFQRSNFMKNLRRFLSPRNRVFLYTGELSGFKISDKSSFNRILSPSEQNIILAQDSKTKNLFNGKAIRLDTVLDDGTAILSEVSFFDFMTTNLVVKSASRTKKTFFGNLYSSLFSEDIREAKRLARKIKSAVYCQPRRCFSDVLSVNELGNIITVSVLLEDIDNRVLIVRRGNKVAISSGNFAASCAGSVSDIDLNEANPFIACASRELKEELGLECNLVIDNIVISKQKLQPAILIKGTLDCRFEDVYNTMISAPDFKEENSDLFAVPKGVLAGIVKRYQFTDVAAFQLVGNCKKWLTTAPKKIDDYKLGRIL